jgi:hypothetical protein
MCIDKVRATPLRGGAACAHATLGRSARRARCLSKMVLLQI